MMDDFFDEIAEYVTSKGLEPVNYRLVRMSVEDTAMSDYVDYPAQWYYYFLAGLTPDEAFEIEYPGIVS